MFGGIAAVVCAPFVAKQAPSLMFHRDAFEFTIAPLTETEIDEFRERVIDRQTGISMRYVKQFDVERVWEHRG